jgi:3-oxoacyl-[acyl-carrier protein] reductase
MRLKEKVAIVTGAARGIGKYYAETLAAEGAAVALVDLDVEAVESSAGSIKGNAIGLKADISDPDAMKEVARVTSERFGGIDILVNNAAIVADDTRHSFLDVPLDYWKRCLEVNVTGALLATQAVIPHLSERGKGKIINQSSAAAQIPVNPYGITKLGMQGLTLGFARNLAKHGINVNCIAPGPVDTEALRKLYTEEQLQQLVQKYTVMGRVGQPADLRGALLFLASDESDWMTGQVVHVDGGFVMHPA